MEELPEDFIEINKENTDYSMPSNYNSEFISEDVLRYTQEFYKVNGFGEYLQDTGVDIMKSVHLYRDLFPQ